MNTHSSKKAFFKESSIGIYFTYALILSVGFPFSHVGKCWCGTSATRFSQVAQRHSYDLCRFFLSWMYLLGGADNCMLSMPFTKSHLTKAVGRVAQIARRWLPELQCDLASVSCSPSFRPDTASFRSCQLLPPRFLDTREAGICAGSRACFSLLFLLDFSIPVDFVKSFKQAPSKFSSSGVEMRKICNDVKLLLGSPTFQVRTLFSTI